MTQEALRMALVALEDLLDQTEAPPNKNCSCHIAPPCSDCVDYSGVRYAIEQANKTITAIKEALAQEQDIAALVTGMEVSIDVSTGDHDSRNRLFGVVDLVQQSQGSKHGLILLVQETKANFKEALAQPAQEPINDGWQITFANGHSGFGVYAHMDEYPEEGSSLLCAVPQWAKEALNKSAYQRGYLDGIGRDCPHCKDYKAMYIKVRDDLAAEQQVTERQTARIVDLQDEIRNLTGEE